VSYRAEPWLLPGQLDASLFAVPLADPADPLAFLAGRNPFASFVLSDFRMMFGA
jgi:hypothetical protein